MNNATQHTPGPWQVIDSKPYPEVCLPNGQMVIAGTVNGMANAALIARAPDLLAERDALTKQVSELRAACESALTMCRNLPMVAPRVDASAVVWKLHDALDKSAIALAGGGK